MDVSYRTLTIAQERIEKLHLPRQQWEKISVFQGSLTYQDARFKGYDAVTLVEVIEHLDLPRLTTLEKIIFGFVQPSCVIVTTPNIEYNVKFERLTRGKFRHPDHRFEWTRLEFQSWANNLASKYGYNVNFTGIGEADIQVGSPTQMAIFHHLTGK